MKMEMEIEGRAGRLGEEFGAFVTYGALHSQSADRHNRFLLLNCGRDAFDTRSIEFLEQRVFLPISAPVRQLLNYANAARHEGVPITFLAEHWAQLLLGSFTPPRLTFQHSRLAKLTKLVERSLDSPWTVREMANRVGVSPSRLHALFQEEMSKTPQEWLAGLRIKKARQWLARTDVSIAELAQRVGYSDQSALTRVMRRVTGLTPGAYTKQQREFRSNKQE